MDIATLEGSKTAPKLVPKCLGAREGLGSQQHVVLVEKVEHPASHLHEKATWELLVSLQFECSHEVVKIDEVRKDSLYQLFVHNHAREL